MGPAEVGRSDPAAANHHERLWTVEKDVAARCPPDGMLCQAEIRRIQAAVRIACAAGFSRPLKKLGGSGDGRS